MTRVTILLCALVLTAAAAAQQVRPIKAAPIQAAPAPQPVQVQPAPAVDAAAAAVVDEEPMQPIETVESLKAANKKLRADLRAARTENTALKDRITQMTTRGGSQVRAWCPSEDVSRSTAGDENNCAISGYSCEPVSGLCRNTCRISTDCAAYHTCDPGTNRCVNTQNGVPGSDDD